MWLDKLFGKPSSNSLADAIAKIAALPASGDKPIQWESLTDHVAWFDRTNAEEIIRQKKMAGNLNDDDHEILKKWVDDGFVILNNLVPNADIDELNQFIDDLFTTNIPNKDVTFLGYTLDKEVGSTSVPHEEMVKLSPAERQANARLSPWRIHELWVQCEAAKRIYLNKKLKDVASLIFDRPAYPRSTINFYLGSQQELHQDMSVFHVYPGNYLIGAWIALEDISADSGPLLFAPGTHKSSLYPDFRNHPQTTLRTCSLDVYDGYYKFTKELGHRDGDPKKFLAKKGDVLLWHGMLVHGGSPVLNPDLTRKSMVIHYLTQGVDQTDKITGPFNWG